MVMRCICSLSSSGIRTSSTDGVPEATDANKELFGTERMLEALNKNPDAAPEEILRNVRAAVDAFVKDAEQFDDLTMLCVEYRGTA
jgi:sigma-B regulation protein RsbU (phosphoserine phosphatase)